MQVLRSLVRSRLHDLDFFFENVSTFNEISTFFNEERVTDGSPQILVSENEVNNSGFSQNVNKTDEISMFVFFVEISLKALTFEKKKCAPCRRERLRIALAYAIRTVLSRIPLVSAAVSFVTKSLFSRSAAVSFVTD